MLALPRRPTAAATRDTTQTRAGATTAEESGSHSIYVSQPKAVVALIAQAASGTRVAAAEPEATGQTT